MRNWRWILLVSMTAAAIAAYAEEPQRGRGGAPQSTRKKVLAWADTRTGFQHDSISHALATIERIGRESGTFDTYIRTDSQLITRKEIVGPPYKPRQNAKNLNFFDAIFFLGTGEELPADQKADLLAFVREDGKGFVGAHTAIDVFFTWPEYGEMLGAYISGKLNLQQGHPWGVLDAPILIEDPDFPAMRHFPPALTLRDEIYVLEEPYSRSNVRVLMRMDPSKLDLSNPNIKRPDRDFPVAYAKPFGKGRVFYSSLGHTEESWDNPMLQKMWLEAIRWALRLTDADITPRPLPSASGR